jgi:hypothetical protein
METVTCKTVKTAETKETVESAETKETVESAETVIMGIIEAVLVRTSVLLTELSTMTCHD